MATRLLVTGRGSIAQRHVRHARALLPALELAVVSSTGELDPSFEPCTRVADVDAGFRWNPDAVVIASASNRHAAELERCLSAGLPCLAEKPLLTRREDLETLHYVADAAARPGTVVVGCNLRYLPALQTLRAALRDRTDLGAVVRAQLEVGQDLRQWRPARDLATSYSTRAADGGGVVFDLVHEIDMARHLLGPLRVVAAVGGHLSALPIDADDVHTALLQCDNDAPVTVSLDYVSQAPVRRYAIVAEGGTFVFDLMERELSLRTAQGTQQLATAAADFDVAATYAVQMRDWIASWTDTAHRTVSPLDEGLASARLMLAMREAAA